MKTDFYFIALLLLFGQCAFAQGNFHLVKDLTPGTDETSLTEMKAIDGYVYFTDSDHGLLRTDGTPEGTIVIENTGSFWYTNYTPTQGGFYFRIQNWVSNYYTIGKTNGQVGAASIANTAFVSITDLIEFNGLVYFVGDDGVYGKEIWKSDGITCSKVKDIGKDNLSSSPRDLRICNGNLFFVANDGVHGLELWKTDGTESGTAMIKDIFANANNAWPYNFEVMNNELYFTAFNTSGRELWKSDGSESGTIMVKDISTGSTSGDPGRLVRLGDEIYFEAYDGVNGRALWKTGGTEATTSMVADINTSVGVQSYITDLVAVNGILYFAGDDGLNGKELWKYDGSEASLLKDLTPGLGDESELKYLWSYLDHLFFISNSQLWKSDGNLCNTVQMTFADGVSYLDWLPYMVVLNDKIFLEAITPSTGGELFYYDYSTGGPKGVCSQTVEFGDITSKTYGDAPFTLSASATTGLPITFTSSDPGVITVNGNIATITGHGEVTITATQPGDVNYSPAFAEKTIVVEKRIITGLDQEQPTKISVYPNPTTDRLTLEGFSPNESVTARLYRVDGQTLFTEEFSGNPDYQLDVSSITPGIYVITIISHNRNFSQRIIKK